MMIIDNDGGHDRDGDGDNNDDYEDENYHKKKLSITKKK